MYPQKVIEKNNLNSAIQWQKVREKNISKVLDTLHGQILLYDNLFNKLTCKHIV